MSRKAKLAQRRAKIQRDAFACPYFFRSSSEFEIHLILTPLPLASTTTRRCSVSRSLFSNIPTLMNGVY